MNLYEITNEYKNILKNMYDDETGEILEVSLTALEKIEGDVKNKGIAIASFIKNMRAEEFSIADAMMKMQERRARLLNKIDHMEQYLKSNMELCEINEISCPYFVIKIKKNPVSVEIADENLIPDDYKKRKEVISIDKVKIKNEILAGVVIPGAELKQNTRLEIK